MLQLEGVTLAIVAKVVISVAQSQNPSPKKSSHKAAQMPLKNMLKPRQIALTLTQSLIDSICSVRPQSYMLCSA